MLLLNVTSLPLLIDMAPANELFGCAKRMSFVAPAVSDVVPATVTGKSPYA